MNIKNTLCTFAGVGGAIVAGLLLKNSLTTKQSANVQAIISEPEECFAGIPLSKLTEVAKQIYHGLYCSVDKWGFLVFHYNSNRGHQTFHAQMTLDDTGKLINLSGHYPGQLRSGADEFAKKANELFHFKK